MLLYYSCLKPYGQHDKGRFTLGGSFRAESRFSDDVVTIQLGIGQIERKLQLAQNRSNVAALYQVQFLHFGSLGAAVT